MYNGYTESAEKIEARKRRILAGYKPQRRTRRTNRGGNNTPPAPVVLDRLGFALAQKRMYEGISPFDVLRAMAGEL